MASSSSSSKASLTTPAPIVPPTPMAQTKTNKPTATSAAPPVPVVRKRGGDVTGVGEIFILHAEQGQVKHLNYQHRLYSVRVLAYDPASYSTNQPKLVWYSAGAVAFEDLPVGSSLHSQGCDVLFLETTDSTFDNVPMFVVRRPYTLLSRAPDTPFTLSIEAVASSDPAPTAYLQSIGLGEQLEVDFTIVPKSGDRHAAEQDFEIDVLIYNKRVKLGQTERIYFTSGKDAHITGPLFNVPDAPVTILASHFTPTPLGGAGGGGTMAGASAAAAPAEHPDEGDQQQGSAKRKRMRNE